MRARGVTLVELLIAATLFLLVTGLAFGYLVPATRAAAKMRARSHLQQSAAVVLSKISQAASTTSPGGFGWSEGPELFALAFNPVDDVQPGDALVRWSEVYDLFWWDAATFTVRQRRWPPGDPSPLPPEVGAVRAKRLTPERLLEVCREPSLVLARGVTAFTVAQSGTQGELIQPVTVSLTLVEEGRETNSQGAQTVTHSLTFRLENQN